MQINITGHHVDVTDPLKEYVETKLQKVSNHFSNITNVHVILTVEKLQQKASAEIHMAGTEVYADAVDEDMYAAIDKLIDKLDKQVIKYKEKLKKHNSDGI